MTVKTVSSAGFCPGVERAVGTVERLIREKRSGERIFTLGPLIHNPQMVRSFEQRGVSAVSEEELPEILSSASAESPVTVVIRAHGIEKRVAALLASAPENVRTVDCTCPSVKKIHGIVDRETADGETAAVILGDPDHPEVRGIRSCAHGRVVVLPKFDEEVLGNLNKEKFIFVSQTTQNINEFKNCKKFIEKVCTNAKIFDTICRVTEVRQSETARLASETDYFFVIGGRHSSNTKKLYETALSSPGRSEADTFLIEGAEELSKLTAGFRHDAVIGITAGASTPRGIIEEVVSTMNNENIIENEDFAGMLEGSLKTLHTGETVKGTITSITPSEIYVDLGAKTTGVIPLAELSENPDVKTEEAFKVGDEVEAFVIKVSDMDGIATLSRKKIEGIQAWRDITSAYENEMVVEGKVIEVVKGGVIMLIGGFRCFVPASLTGVPKDGDLASIVGQTFKARIIEINEQRRRAVASISAVIREERRAKEAAFWETVEEGRQYTGKVKSLTSYGAFVDLGGVDGMVHTTELSWQRIKSPADVVSIGDEITVYVKSFDQEKRRVSLGYKTEATNPWNIFKANFQVGDVTSVKIVSLLAFGAFAEVIPGAEGLIHISQIADHKIGKPADVLEVGQVVDAKITAIDDEKHNISLSIRALLEDIETAAEEAVAEEAVAEAATEEPKTEE